MLVALSRAEEVLLAPAATYSVGRRLAVYALEVVAIAGLLGAFAWIYLTHGFQLAGFFTSDALYLPALMQDLISDGGSYSDWNLTPSPYFFPDWPMFALSHVVTGGNVYYSVLVFTLLQFTLTYLLLRAIYGELFSDSRSIVFAIASIALLVSLTVDSVPIVQDARISAHHFGELMIILLALWLVMRILRSPRPWPLTAVLCFVAFLTALSDGLFVVHYAIPLVFAADFIWHRREMAGRPFLCVAFLPALSAFAGSRFTLSAMPKDHQFDYRFGMEYFDDNVERVETLVSIVLNADILALAFIPLFYVTAIAVLVWHVWKSRFADNPGAVFTIVFPLVSMFFSLAMALLINVDIPGRYVAPAFVLPIVLLFAPSISISKPIAGLAAGGIVGALALGSIVMTIIPNGFDFRSGFYPGDVACLDRTLSERGLTNGIGQYWTAKRVTALSQADLRVVSVFNHLGEYHWINNSTWFRDTYDFALVEERAEPGLRLDAKKLVSLSGEPAFKAECGFITIYGYERDTLVTSERKP